MGQTATDLEDLRKAFCPPIDDAVFYAIAWDYDLPQDRDKLATILDDLKIAALKEEDTEFDPSGTGGIVRYPEQADASHTIPEDDSTSNEFTSTTTALTDLRLDRSTSDAELKTIDEKKEYLRNLFPSLSPDRISDALTDEGSLDRAIDELLNVSFLEDGGSGSGENYQSEPKGIEAFAEGLRPRKRKGRNKTRMRTDDSSRTSSVGSVGSAAAPSPNVWTEITDDVNFICSRTALSPSAVTSVYHANGARLQPTLRALAEKHGSGYALLHPDESIIHLQITEVKTNYPDVSDSNIYGLLLMTRNHPSAVCELLEAMESRNAQEGNSVGKLKGVASYTPIDLTPKDIPIDSEPQWTTIPTSNSRQLAAAHGLAASQAFSQASSAYKRSKSDRLMGGAAAYYSSVGHEKLKMAKELGAAAAEAHVQAQSTSMVLDLHGISVSDAVRIANVQTQHWWDSLGDAKYALGGGGPMRAGYSIVTGVGSHSKNHAPRLGPAVSKALIRAGWKVEVGQGELLVIGKAKR